MTEYPTEAVKSLEEDMASGELGLRVSEDIRKVLDYADRVRGATANANELETLRTAYTIAAQKLAAIKIVVDGLSRRD